MEMSPKSKRIIFTLIPSVLVFVYVFPRLLIAMFGKGSPWTSYLYQYTFGGVFFFIGMYIIIATKAAVPGRGRDSTFLKILLAGFVFFLTLHGLWIVLSLYIPFKGAL